MRTLLLLPVLAVAFFLGARIAAGKPADRAEDIAKLLEQQRILRGDLQRIEKAVKDIRDIAKLRATGLFVLNHEEKKMERQGRKDFHIFCERYRNDTLQVLAIYDKLLGRQAYVDPLRKIFGKAIDELVAVDWDDEDISTICEELSEGYGVNLFVKGNIDSRQSMTLRGEMTLLAILLQIENVFSARLIEEDGELWFTHVTKAGKVEDE